MRTIPTTNEDLGARRCDECGARFGVPHSHDCQYSVRAEPQSPMRKHVGGTVDAITRALVMVAMTPVVMFTEATEWLFARRHR